MAEWNTENISSFYPNWGRMSPDAQNLARQYALADQTINGAPLPDFDSFAPAAPLPTQGRLFTQAPSAYDDGTSTVAKWSGVPWTKQVEEAALSQGASNGFQNDGTWITAPDGSTFAVSDILANRPLTEIAARNQQYLAGTLTPDAVPWVNTADYGEGAGLVTGSKAERFGPAAFGLPSSASVGQMTQATGLDIPGQMRAEHAANNQAIVPKIQAEMAERIKSSLPDVANLLPNRNLDGSINYDWMVQYATGKATKPAYYDQYVAAWDKAAADFMPKQTAAPQGLAAPASSPIAQPAATSAADQAPTMAASLRSFGQPAAQSNDPFSQARAEWSTWGAGQGDYAKPSWWGGVKGGEFKPLDLTEQPAPGSPEAMSQEAPFNPVYQPSTATTAPGFTTSAAMGLANSNGMYQPSYGANPDVMPASGGDTPWGAIGGAVGSLLPVPGGSLIGRGLGTAAEVSRANDTLAGMGVQGQNLGVSDWASAMVPSWLGGTDVNTATNAAITAQAPYANALYSFGGPFAMDLQPSSLGGGNFGFGAGGMY
jgi:hypothetical protein